MKKISLGIVLVLALTPMHSNAFFFLAAAGEKQKYDYCKVQKFEPKGCARFKKYKRLSDRWHEAMQKYDAKLRRNYKK